VTIAGNPLPCVPQEVELVVTTNVRLIESGEPSKTL